MNRQMILMALVSAVIILLLIIPALERPRDEHQPELEAKQAPVTIDIAPEQVSLTPSAISGEGDQHAVPPLNADLQPAIGGLRLVLDKGEALYMNSLAEDVMGRVAVHLVEREMGSGDSERGWVKQYDLVVIRPDSGKIDAYPLYTEEQEINHYFNPTVKLLNEREAMFFRRSQERETVQYELAVIRLDSGQIRALPAFWKIQKGSEDERDFLLSSHYERNEDGHITEVMLTSYEGKRWQMDIESFKLIGHRGQTYPAAGDPGSSPPRPLMYPTPDLERFAYSFTEKVPIYISNHFMVADSKSGKVIKLFSIDDAMQLSDSGLVWNKESSRFFLEYAKKGDEMGVSYDSGPVVFAQEIAFYDSDGERSRVLRAAKGERLSVYNWLDEHRLLVESYRPVKRTSGGWSKEEVVYQEYDVRTGKLAAYRKEQDAATLPNGETISLRTAGGTYDSKAFVYLDQKNKRIWTPDVKGRTHRTGGKLYIDVADADMQQRIFEWDEEVASLRLAYSTNSSEQQLRQVVGHWLMIEDRAEGSYYYMNTQAEPERNTEGLPVLSDEIARKVGAEWWKESSSHSKSLLGNEVRAKAKTRYGTLRMISKKGELHQSFGGMQKYYGHYDVEFINTAGQKTSLPSLEELALELEQPVGEMKVLEYEGFDLVLLLTHQFPFSKGYDGEISNVRIYAVTEGGEAVPLTFRYASSGGIELAESLGMVSQDGAIGSSGQAVILQSYIGDRRMELTWTADIQAKTLTLTAMKDRTKEYESIRVVVERYANRLEQALGLTDIALPEGKMDEVKLRSLFTEKAWNNPGFQRLRTDFAKLEKAGTPSRAFAWQPINARYDEYGNIRVTFTLNLFYAVGWAAHLDAMLKLDDFEWTFHDFGTLRTEYLEGYKDLDNELGMKGYNGLVIPNALER